LEKQNQNSKNQIPAEVGLIEPVMTSLYGLLEVEAGVAAAITILI
jgi:hypothetical protein